jgi:hypothetical protein
MTIKEIFDRYPINQAGFSEAIGMTKQQLNVYVKGGPITERNRLRIQDELQRIGKELQGVLVTHEVKDNKTYLKAIKYVLKEVNKIK